MTATNKLINQKFNTMMQTMKKKQDTKYSESIIWYMSGDHCNTVCQRLRIGTYKKTLLTPFADDTMNTCRAA